MHFLPLIPILYRAQNAFLDSRKYVIPYKITGIFSYTEPETHAQVSL